MATSDGKESEKAPSRIFIAGRSPTTNQYVLAGGRKWFFSRLLEADRKGIGRADQSAGSFGDGNWQSTFARCYAGRGSLLIGFTSASSAFDKWKFEAAKALAILPAPPRFQRVYAWVLFSVGAAVFTVHFPGWYRARRAPPGGVRLGDLNDIDRMVSRTLELFGQIDILVNNAGVTRRADIMDLTEEDWDRIHRVNAKGVFFCLQRVAREMIPRRSGRIINIASIAGKGYEGTSNAAYAASKGAVISLTKTAAQQLGRYNINVNSVCPGVTRTGLSEANLSVRAQQEGVTVEEMERRRSAVIPLQRANDPEDIAAMVAFLASPGARNITGQSFNVDGGLIPD